ncbi:MAG TPA: hypothetical protein VGL83_00960 [Stellaceae bacterium]|jgi:hypothetical protein
MPIVLAENEETESGIHYRDRTGVSYQYPKKYARMIREKYARMIREGERFIYYRGRKTKQAKRQPQVYFGFGTIGQTGLDHDAPGRMKCAIFEYTAFNQPLFFKSPHGEYWEKGGIRRGYFQAGVRRISEEEFGRILSAALWRRLRLCIDWYWR